MTNLLSKGLNFAVLPKTLDMTQVLVDLKRFERTVIWNEFWYGKENKDTPAEQKIFKEQKSNLPKNYVTPGGIKNFLGAIKSDITDPKNKNKVQSNLPVEEIKAMKELIELEKKCTIVVKPCDKGSGIIVINFDDYITVCKDHLRKELNSKPYYEKVEQDVLKIAKTKIKSILEEAHDNEIISKEEFTAMNPESKKPGKFYATFKVHKPHKENELPPLRPIVSASGSITENISLFVEHHIKDLANKHDSYLKDTPDFLRKVEDINNKEQLPENVILVTMDVSSLYTNIPQDEGIECTREALEKRDDKTVPTEFIIRLLELALKWNIFEFDNELFLQIIGTAMGTRPAPAYANMFMAKQMDEKIIEKIVEFRGLDIIFFKRFLDDLFFIFSGSTKMLHLFHEELNQIHPNIKLTMEHTFILNEKDPCQCKQKHSLPFLDTSLSIEKRKICVDLYRKPTDRNMYLLPSSCHPPHNTKNIPFSLALRIVRICSDPDVRDKRLEELKYLLSDRNYLPGVVNAAILKARSISRSEALRPAAKNVKFMRPIFVTTYDPRLPDLPAILNKHYRSMVNMDNYLKEVFPYPPMLAYKRPNNIKSFLIKAKVFNNKNRTSQRVLNGMKKCTKQCPICPYVNEGKSIQSDNFTWFIRKNLNCQSKNVIYMIECNLDKCKQRYIGESERRLTLRISEHLGYIRNKIYSKNTGFHFNQPGHSEANLTVTILEKVKKLDTAYRKEREHTLIRKFNTFYKGMNRMP